MRTSEREPPLEDPMEPLPPLGGIEGGCSPHRLPQPPSLPAPRVNNESGKLRRSKKGEGGRRSAAPSSSPKGGGWRMGCSPHQLPQRGRESNGVQPPPAPPKGEGVEWSAAPTNSPKGGGSQEGYFRRGALLEKFRLSFFPPSGGPRGAGAELSWAWAFTHHNSTPAPAIVPPPLCPSPCAPHNLPPGLC